MRRRMTLAIVTVIAVGAIAGGAVAFATSDSDENGATWEVEVTKTDGATVDVRLDDSYKVVTVESDSESADNDDSSE